MNHTLRRDAAMIGLWTALLTTLLTALAFTPASATAYRYWSYWQGAEGTWTAAQTGPGSYSLVDKDVQGWRFGISTEELTQAPDNDPQFATLCPGLAEGDAPDGQLRVAVVIDPGFEADAPQGQTPPADSISCVTVPIGSTGNQALAAAGRVSDEKGLVCAINGYPEGECGQEVPDAQASAAAAAARSEAPNPHPVSTSAAAPQDPPDSEDDTSRTGLIVGAAALVALIGAAVALLVSRRNQDGG